MLVPLGFLFPTPTAVCTHCLRRKLRTAAITALEFLPKYLVNLSGGFKGIAIDLRGTDSSVFQYKVPAAEFDEFPESPYARIADRCSTRGEQQTPGRPTRLLAACSAPCVLAHAVSQAAHVARAPR